MFPIIKKIAFIAEFYHKGRTLAESCKELHFTGMPGETPDPIPLKPEPPSKNTLYSIANVPSYLRLSGIDEKRFSRMRFGSLRHFTIDLSGYTDIGSYMRKQFSKKSRANVMRAIRRLEKCYELQHVRYWGEIDKDVCNYYLSLLKEMIIQRFDERGEESDTLKIWGQISSTLYEMILSKKASLYVIEDNKKPIAISIAYHYPSIFFYYITSYDTDYSKFSVGQYTLFKQLEWCLQDTSYRFFEMGWGDLEYKRRWSNRICNLDHIFIVPRKNIVAKLLAIALGNKTRMQAYLLEKKVNVLYKKILGAFHKQEADPNTLYQLEACEGPPLESLLPLDINMPENTRFRSIRNDFIYHTEEKSAHVNLFKDPAMGEFYIVGQANVKKVVFTESR